MTTTSDSQSERTRIVILGGGFGGVYTAQHLEKLCRARPDIEIVLVSQDNFLLMTPLLFEICSGALDSHHCSFPIRAFLKSTRFIEATVLDVDLERRVVHLAAAGVRGELAYDQLVLALGAMTNRVMIPGSQNAFTFKNLADALLLRTHIIERFERADVERDPERKRSLLTFVIIGGGLVGVELFGELTAFVDGITRYYKNVNRSEVRFILLQAVDRIMPEIDAKLAEYGARTLAKRPGAEIRTNAAVQAIEPGKVRLPKETIAADTIVLAAGILPCPVVANLPVAKDKRGHIIVDGTMRCQERPEVWAIGDSRVDPSTRRQTLSEPGPACPARGEGAGPQYSCRTQLPAAETVRLPHAGNDGVVGTLQGIWANAWGARAGRHCLVRAADLLFAADAGLGPPPAHID